MLVTTEKDYLPGLSVVVVNYRTPGDLGEFLTSLSDAPPACNWEAAVVNVAPLPEDAAAAKQWCRKNPARELVFGHNCGYAKAANGGACLGDYDTLAIFNADVVLRPGALDACRKALWSNDEWGILGPRQVDEQNRLTAAGIFGPATAPAHRGWREVDRSQYRDIRDDSVYVAGSAFFVKRYVWDFLTECDLYRLAAPDASGALLETQLYYEEAFACLHARFHGWKSVFYGADDGACVHKWSRSVRANEVDTAPLMKASREQFRTACDVHGIAHE